MHGLALGPCVCGICSVTRMMNFKTLTRQYIQGKAQVFHYNVLVGKKYIKVNIIMRPLNGLSLATEKEDCDPVALKSGFFGTAYLPLS